MARRPPRIHPRAKQIMRLHQSLAKRRSELATIEAERDGEAAPVALEIEALEAEVAAVSASRAELVKAGLFVGDQLFEAMKARDRIAAELTEADEAIEQIIAIRDVSDELQADTIARTTELDGKLLEARSRFDEVRTTSRGRAVMRKIESIETHIERILDRHPEARIYQLEATVLEEAARRGILARVNAVDVMMRTPEFAAAFDKAIDEAKGTPRLPQSPNQMRDLAFEVLHALGVSTADVHFRVTWDAKAKSVTFIAPGVHPATRQRIIDEILAHGSPPDEAQQDVA
jgi:chromosome segregation ATPase